ncbi:1D-myo-inositol 2-acetamido-2-deoxy-alpha-D-glucopyranoside deacetylase [Metalysinibacillus saudimassiliensis]|uniref:1D-myo-inositol 2-acetamido-2-deoxy-alpha-D-glucopyranoside deacetylase n=1 Tax=Metalysinibacillus saudimassiliensis TaxID=1461583 RepID=A0A078MAA1_9BACL|nr:1D-myo-inositol 2-acetamido-2-deoxy-alpha-D-glucopyranoside deacetylase [Metalysinibacillus saudimassiliensis]
MEKQRQILIVYPHPDDESFSVAGIAAMQASMGVPVTYACLTLGEMGRNLGNPPFATRESLPEIRKKELIAACEAIGIQDLRMMGLRDKTVEFEDDEKMVGMITDLITELNPSMIFTFLPKYCVHPDHEATARAVVEAVRRMPKAERPTLLGAGFANNTEEEMGEADFVVDIRAFKEQKLNALKAHASQTGWMLQELDNREEEHGETTEDAWFTTENFYTITFND